MKSATVYLCACLVFHVLAAISKAQDLSFLAAKTQQLPSGNTHEKTLVCLEYANSLSGPWTNWDSLLGTGFTGAVMSIDMPMFFRVSPYNTSNQQLIATGTPVYVESDPLFNENPAASVSLHDIAMFRNASTNGFLAGGILYSMNNKSNESSLLLVANTIHTQGSWQAVDQLQTIPPPVQGVLLCNTNEIKWMGNDGPALLNAMELLEEDGCVYLGPGEYSINGTISFKKSRTKLIGSGNPVFHEATKSLAGGTLLNEALIRQNAGVQDFGIEHLGIETTNTKNDIVVASNNNTADYLGLTLKNISVLGRTNTAHIIGASGRNIRMENVRSYFGGWGVALKTYDLQWHGGTVCNALLGVYVGANDRIGQPTASKNNTISNVEFVRTHDYIAQGFQIGAVSGATTDGLFIHNCRALSGVKSLIRVQSPGIDFGDATSGIQGAVIDTCYAETPSSHAFSFVEGAQHVIVNNCTVYNSPHIPIYVRYSTNITVRNANMIQCAGTYTIGAGGHLRECSINGTQYAP